MELEPFDYRDHTRLVNEVDRRVALVENTAYVALVHQPSTTQRIVTAKKLAMPALIDDYQEACIELRKVMHRLPIPDSPRPPKHSVMTFVVRSGPCVFGPNERNWLFAWRYSNHLTNAYSSNLILVTEHGWCDFMTHEAGLTPAARPAVRTPG
jgi:hypothetical protein